MANGDLAASIGIPTVSPTDDKRLGYDEINRALDVIAQHLISGTHPASAITSGVLNGARIPNLNASRITAGTLLLPIDTLSTCQTGSLVARGNLNATSDLYVDGARIVNGAVDADGTGRFGGSYNTDVSATSNRRTVWITPTGLLGHTASSERLKDNIRPAVIDTDAMLALEVSEFEYKGSDYTDTGLIAERVAEVPGLEFLVFHDTPELVDGEEPAEPQIAGIHYDRIAVALLAVVQDQAAKLAALTARVTALENGTDNA